jgi:hypothetical protein
VGGCRDDDGRCVDSFSRFQRDARAIEPCDPRPCPERPGREPGGELRRDGVHPPCRKRRIAFGEHAEEELQGAAGSAQLAVEQYAAEKRPEESFDDALRETLCVQRI